MTSERSDATPQNISCNFSFKKIEVNAIPSL